MLTVAAVLLAITAVGGLATAVIRARSGANPPLPLALVHGGVGAAGLVVLVAAGVADGFSTAHTVSVVLLVIAAVGGFVVFGSHLRARLISLPVIAVHAVVAVAGYVSLLVAAL